VKGLLDGDPLLTGLWVRGEISNFRHHTPSGHLYFTLKDATAQVKAVMFRGDNQRLPFRPEDGLRVIAGGRVTVYERDGQYQLYVREMQPDGIGSLYLAFEQLKGKLAEEGLFDEALKRPLPLLPRAVGIVTSPTGAALRDIITVAGRRFPAINTDPQDPRPGIPFVISPVLVQGAGAAADIVRGLELVDRRDDIDVIILARGGGAIEELWAFNDEALARAIRATRRPVVAGIGHETDVTIADLVADRRAATPSNAAELAVPSKADLAGMLGMLRGRLERAGHEAVGTRRRAVETLGRSAGLAYPERLLDGRRQRVDDLTRSLEFTFTQLVDNLRLRRDVLAGRLDALSPLAVLGRGYALCRRKTDGRLVLSVSLVTAGDAVEVRLRDGVVECAVSGVQAEQDGPKAGPGPARPPAVPTGALAVVSREKEE
jgi:exodeoxyribonuclease VII large subunit